jgi:hypothetical protein
MPGRLARPLNFRLRASRTNAAGRRETPTREYRRSSRKLFPRAHDDPHVLTGRPLSLSAVSCPGVPPRWPSRRRFRPSPTSSPRYPRHCSVQTFARRPAVRARNPSQDDRGCDGESHQDRSADQRGQLQSLTERLARSREQLASRACQVVRSASSERSDAKPLYSPWFLDYGPYCPASVRSLDDCREISKCRFPAGQSSPSGRVGVRSRPRNLSPIRTCRTSGSS